MKSLNHLKRIARHVRRWNKWRKRNLNNKLHKFLVLIGIIHSPTFFNFLDDEQVLNIKGKGKYETN